MIAEAAMLYDKERKSIITALLWNGSRRITLRYFVGLLFKGKPAYAEVI